MVKSLYKVIAFFLSIAIYLGILFVAFTYFFDLQMPQKIEIKADTIEVYLTEQSPKKAILHKKKLSKKETTIKKATGSQKAKKASDIKELFSTIKTPKQTKRKAKKHSKKKEAPSKYKGHGGKRAKELLKKLHFQEPKLASKKSIKSVSGKQDPYLQKVYKILYAHWMPSELSAGNRAKVLIQIDKYGNFDFKVLQFSQSEIFNAELQDYLERMRQEQFPTPKRNREFIVYFEAKQ